MSKFSKIHTVTVHGWEGTGRSVTAAKQRAKERIEAAAQGSWTPIICHYRGMVGMAWREPDCWCYTISDTNMRPLMRAGRNYSSCVCRSEEDAVRSMVRHLAQNGFDSLADRWDDRPEILTNDEDWREFRRWAWWQTCMVEAARQGVQGDAERRAYADAQPMPTV